MYDETLDNRETNCRSTIVFNESLVLSYARARARVCARPMHSLRISPRRLYDSARVVIPPIYPISSVLLFEKNTLSPNDAARTL